MHEFNTIRHHLGGIDDVGHALRCSQWYLHWYCGWFCLQVETPQPVGIEFTFEYALALNHNIECCLKEQCNTAGVKELDD